MRYCILLIPILMTVNVSAQASPEPVSAKANHLLNDANRSKKSALSAIDLIRFNELNLWLEPGWTQTQIRRAAQDESRHPLSRAVAWWLVRQNALERLDIPAAEHANRALGLQTEFVFRPGPAPHPTQVLDPKAWTKYPPHLGRGVVCLDKLVRPRGSTVATLVTRLVAERDTPAVLRMGYDDAISVWLNGDEVYRSEEQHDHWLDQAAVPVYLNQGSNRLVVEVRQKTNAWRFLIRVTDARGHLLPVYSQASPWGPVPEAASGPLIENVENLWTLLYTLTDQDSPTAQAIRDLADYARVSGLPNRDQTLVQVTMETAWNQDPSHLTLRAWLRLLDEERRGPIRARHAVSVEGLKYDALMVTLEEAWDHYFARRLSMAWTLVSQILADEPSFRPANRLRIVLLSDAGFHQTGISSVQAQIETGFNLGYARTKANLLRDAGRFAEEYEHLEEMVKRDMNSVDVQYRLGLLGISHGRLDAAATHFDRIVSLRPALWNYEIELIDALVAARQNSAAHARLKRLWQLIPGDESIGQRLFEQEILAGTPLRAEAILASLIDMKANPEVINTLKGRLKGYRPNPKMGPGITSLLKVECPKDVPAVVLHHHGRVELDTRGHAERWIRRVVKICTAVGARRYAEMRITHVPSIQDLSVPIARLIRPGHPEVSPLITDQSVSDVGARLYFDMNTQKLAFPKAQAGDVVEVLWRLRDLQPHPAFPGDYGEVAYLQEEIPRRMTVLESVSPKTNRLKHDLVDNMIDLEHIQTTKGPFISYRVVARNVPGVPPESKMPGPTATYAHVHLSTTQSWQDVERKYARLLQDRDKVTADIQALADALAPTHLTRRQRIETLFMAVMQRVRYVGLEYGIHGFQPNEPMKTWERGYGDCKDKSLLLMSLLAARGIKSHFVLVRTLEEGPVPPNSSSWAVFNHAMLYLPEESAYLDPTMDHTAPFELPPGDEGASVLIIGLNQGLTTVPYAQPSAHQDAWTMTLKPITGKGIVGSVKWSIRGQLGAQVRRDLSDPHTRIDRANRYLSQRFPGAFFSDLKISDQSLNPGETVVYGQFENPTQGKKASEAFIPVGLHRWSLVQQLAPEARRQHSKISNRGSLTVIDWSLTGLEMTSTDLSDPISLKSRFGELSLETRPLKRGIRVLIRLEIRPEPIGVDAYPKYRHWLSQVEGYLNRKLKVVYREN